MSGAYTAQPAADTTPTVPPGWDPTWPGPPGAYPPGYEPTLTLALTVDTEIPYNLASTVSGSLRDNSTFPTREPDDTEIIWTASAGLKFSGDPMYASSITSTCVFGTYWDAVTPGIKFDVDSGDVGGTVTLVGTAVIDGVVVTGSSIITIEDFLVVYQPVVATSTLLQYGTDATCYVRILTTSSTYIFANITSLTWSATVDGDNVGSGTLTLTGDGTTSELYDGTLDLDSATRGGSTIILTVTLSTLGEEEIDIENMWAIADFSQVDGVLVITPPAVATGSTYVKGRKWSFGSLGSVSWVWNAWSVTGADLPDVDPEIDGSNAKITILTFSQSGYLRAHVASNAGANEQATFNVYNQGWLIDTQVFTLEPSDDKWLNFDTTKGHTFDDVYVP